MVTDTASHNEPSPTATRSSNAFISRILNLGEMLDFATRSGYIGYNFRTTGIIFPAGYIDSNVEGYSNT